MSVAESVMGVAVGSFSPTSVELKISYIIICCSQVAFTILSDLSHRIAHLVGARLVLFSSSCTRHIQEKSPKRFR